MLRESKSRAGWDSNLQNKERCKQAFAIIGLPESTRIVALLGHSAPTAVHDVSCFAALPVSASSSTRNGPEVLPRCHTTDKSQVASLSAMGTMTIFGILRW